MCILHLMQSIVHVVHVDISMKKPLWSEWGWWNLQLFLWENLPLTCTLPQLILVIPRTPVNSCQLSFDSHSRAMTAYDHLHLDYGLLMVCSWMGGMENTPSPPLVHKQAVTITDHQGIVQASRMGHSQTTAPNQLRSSTWSVDCPRMK